MVFSCTCCARLGKDCVKSDNSDHCDECVKEGCSHCVETCPSYLDAKWHHLTCAQHSIKDEEEVLLAKLLCLQKQEQLLHEQVNEFISHEFHEIAELEELELKEHQVQEQEELQRQCNCSAADNHNISATWENPSLSQMMASPSFWENLNFSAVGDIASPSGDNHPDVQ